MHDELDFILGKIPETQQIRHSLKIHNKVAGMLAKVQKNLLILHDVRMV